MKEIKNLSLLCVPSKQKEKGMDFNMARMKRLFTYAIWVIAFFIFSQIMIYIAINTTYKYKPVEGKSSLITTAEVQATSINGIAKCWIKNNTQNKIENKYIKIDCYSKNDVLMGTKYIKIDEMQTNEEKEFEVRFNYSRVDKAQIEIVNELPQNTEERQIISDPEMSMAMVISALILLINFG